MQYITLYTSLIWKSTTEIVNEKLEILRFCQGSNPFKSFQLWH